MPPPQASAGVSFNHPLAVLQSTNPTEDLRLQYQTAGEQQTEAREVVEGSSGDNPAFYLASCTFPLEDICKQFAGTT